MGNTTTYATGIDPATGKEITQAQPDWAQKNKYAPDFIKNKASSGFVQQNADWNAVSGVTAILNKPIIPPGSVVPTCMPFASQVNVLANGTDQTTLLNTIFANANYSGIIMDYSAPGAVTILGTVNCQGKMILFRPGNKFTGSGTLDNVVIDAGYQQKLFDTTVSLTNASSAPSKFSAIWYGAGTGDSQPAIQKSIDTVIANNSIKTVFIPSGSYTINSPLTIYKWNGANYSQVTVRIEGEESFWNNTANGTRITCAYKNTYALGIQLGKGIEIKNIKFTGGFNPPFTAATPYSFFTCTFAAFTDGLSRDSQFSPYSGIVIDPFGPAVPADGGYPGLTSYYRGSGSGGSTGTIIEDCFLSNFVFGIITSPNGQTANAELCNIHKIQFANMKACIVGCQDQEKLNVVSYAACWANTHTFINFGGYGAGTPGNWHIDNVNIAGALNRFIFRHGAGYFPVHIEKVYAESIGSFGEWTASTGDSLDRSIIDFINLDVFIAYQPHFITAGVNISNSSFRYYDGVGEPLWFQGGIFKGCSFSKLPYGADQLIACNTGTFGINYPIDITSLGRQTASRSLASGLNKYIDHANLIQGKEISLNPTNTNQGGILLLDGITNSASSIVVAANIATVTPPTTDDLARAVIGNLAIDMATGDVLGVITAVGGSTYTISYVPDGVVTGSFTIGVWCPIMYFSFMGDITTGSPIISNVVLDFGTPSDLMSTSFGCGFIKIPGFYQYRAYSQGARMLSYNSGAGTITMDRNASETATEYYFSSNGAVKVINQLSDGSGSGSTIPNAELFPKGSRFFTNIPNGGRKEFMITSTGYYVNSPKAAMYDMTIDRALLLFTTQVVNYVLALADEFSGVEMNTAAANTVTVPPESSVPWEIGCSVVIEQIGAGATTITAGAGVTFVGLSLVTTGVGSILTLIYQGGDQWLVA